MFLNILRISASNVLKTFFNVIVSIGCTVSVSCYFHSQKPTEAHIRFIGLAASLASNK